MRKRKLSVRFSPNDIIDAKEMLNKEGTAQKYRSHTEFIVDLFKIKHNVLVIDYSKLVFSNDPNELFWIVEGVIGEAISDRLS